MKPTEEQRRRLLVERANRVACFARAFNGKDNALVRDAAHHVLETHRSPLGALWLHVRHVFDHYRILVQSSWRFSPELFWLRHVKRMTDAEIEKRWFPETEEGDR